MSLKCLIVDDEPLARQLLEGYISNVPGLELVKSCQGAMEAFEILHDKKIDLMFLDIQMPGINGLNFLKSLKNPPAVIFTTAYSDHAVEAFELEVADYLLKPITFERFLKATQKLVRKEPQASQAPASPETALFIKENKRLVRLEFEDIIYLEGAGDYVKIITIHQTHLTYSTLTKMEEWLPPSLFVRIHRSFLINISKLKFIEGNYAKVDDFELPLGLTYKEAVIAKFERRQP